MDIIRVRYFILQAHLNRTRFISTTIFQTTLQRERFINFKEELVISL
jgi:hypothetical protein